MAQNRLVKVTLAADVEKFIADLNRAERAVDKLGRSGDGFRDSSRKVADGQEDVATATSLVEASSRGASTQVATLTKNQQVAAASALRVTQAQNRHADALDRVGKAERDRATAWVGGDTAKRVAAEDRLAKARRDLAVASQSLDLATVKAAGSTDGLTNSLSRNQKVSERSSLSIGHIAAAAAVLGPGLIPIAGAAIAASTALVGMGLAGGLAVVGIKKEMADGTTTGERYKSGLESLKGSMESLGVTAASGVMGGFEDVVEAVSQQLPSLNQQVATMSTVLGGTAAPAVRGLLNLLVQMTPAMESTGLGAVGLAEAFERWSQTDSFSRFLSAAQAQLPGVGDMLVEVGTAIGHLITAAAPMGGTVVTALTLLAAAINAIPVDQLSFLIEVAIKGGLAFKAWTAISGIMTRFGASTRAAASGATALGTSTATAAAGMAAVGTAGATAAAGVDRYARSADSAATKQSRWSGLGKVGVTALLGVGAAASSTGTQVDNFGRSTAALEGDLLGAQNGAVSLDGVFSDLQLAMQPDGSMRFAEGLKSLSTAGQTTEKTIGTLVTGLGTFGTGATSTVTALEGRMKSLGEVLAGMVQNGQQDRAAQIFKTISAEAEKAGMPISRLKELMPAYGAALQDVANKQKLAGQAAGASAPPISELGRALAKLDADADGLGLSMDKVGKAIEGLGGAAMNQTSSNVAWGQSVRDVKTALQESGGSVDQLSEKGGRAAIAQQNMAAAGHKLVSSMAQNGASATTLGAKYMQLRESFIQANSGMEGGRQAATKLADAYGYTIPNIQTTVATLTKMGQAGAVAQGGLAGLSLQMNNIGQTVATLNGKSVTIPAKAPNAEQTASLLLSISSARASTDGKSVTIPTSALGAPATQAALTNIEGARKSTDGKSVTIPTSALNAANTHALLSKLSTAAVTADGKVVVIPTSTPNAEKVTAALQGITAKAVTADSKSVTITASSPMAPSVTAAIQRLQGATVSADSKSVRVDTSSPNAANTVRQINGITQSARVADSTSAYITVNTNAGAARGAILGAMLAAQNKTVYITTVFRNIGQQAGAAFARAQGGAAFPGAPAFAAGGTWDARRGGQVFGAGSRTSDSVAAQMTFGPASLSNYEHVWTGAEVEKSGGHGVMYAARDLARQGRLQDVLAAGVRAGFAGGGTLASRQQLAAMRAWQPAQSSHTVTVATPSSSGLSAADRALITKASRDAAAAVVLIPAAVKAGMEGRTVKSAGQLARNERIGGRT